MRIGNLPLNLQNTQKNEHRNVLLKKKNKSRKIWLLTYIITSNGTYKNWKIDFYICHLHWGFRHDFNRCYMTSNIIYYYIQRRHSFNSWWFFEIFTITQASIVYKDTWLDNKYVKRKIIFCLYENHHGKYMIDFAYCNYKTKMIWEIISTYRIRSKNVIIVNMILSYSHMMQC